MTEKQKQVLDWVAAFIKQKGYSPSYQEIADGCGLSSRSKSFMLVNRLIAEGHLIDGNGRHRSLRLADPVARISTAALRAELDRRGELYSPIILAAIKRAGLEAHL